MQTEALADNGRTRGIFPGLGLWGASVTKPLRRIAEMRPAIKEIRQEGAACDGLDDDWALGREGLHGL